MSSTDTKCNICKKDPCNPWSDKHDDAFRVEIEDQAVMEIENYCQTCGEWWSECTCDLSYLYEGEKEIEP